MKRIDAFVKSIGIFTLLLFFKLVETKQFFILVETKQSHTVLYIYICLLYLDRMS